MSRESLPALPRRAYLAAVPVGLLAGCTSAEESPPGIGELTVENRAEDPVEAVIRFDQDDEQYETTVSLSELSDGDSYQQTIVEPWMGDHGSWELAVEAFSNTERYSSEEFDQRFYDYDATDCVLLRIRIDSDGISIKAQTVAVDCP